MPRYNAVVYDESTGEVIGRVSGSRRGRIRLKGGKELQVPSKPDLTFEHRVVKGQVKKMGRKAERNQFLRQREQ